MGTSYGLGFIDFHCDADASRQDKEAALGALARAAGVTVRDYFDGVPVEATPDGAVTELMGQVAMDLREAVSDTGGRAASDAYRHLQGYVVCVEGARKAGFTLPAGGDCHVGPLQPLVETLDALLAREDVPEASQELHRALRDLCDRAQELSLPLNIGS